VCGVLYAVVFTHLDQIGYLTSRGSAFRVKTRDLFFRNALVCSKQVSLYSRTLNCPYVALFNWDILLLYGFDLADEELPFTAGRKADLAWVNETDDASNHTEKCPIRKALLGWLVVVFEQKLGK
jgi:hypothetical protein